MMETHEIQQNKSHGASGDGWAFENCWLYIYCPRASQTRLCSSCFRGVHPSFKEEFKAVSFLPDIDGSICQPVCQSCQSLFQHKGIRQSREAQTAEVLRAFKFRQFCGFNFKYIYGLSNLCFWRRCFLSLLSSVYFPWMRWNIDQASLSSRERIIVI